MGLVAPAVIGGGIGLATSAFGANQQRKAIKQQMRDNNRAVEIELGQAKVAADRENEVIRRNAARVAGLISVSAAERGVGSSGSTAALQLSGDADAAFNRRGVAQGLYNRQESSLQSLRTGNRAVASRAPSLFMAGISGALQGATTGLQIGQGLSDMASASKQAYFGPDTVTGNNNPGWDFLPNDPAQSMIDDPFGLQP